MNKLLILRIISVLLIVAAVGLYVYGIVVNGDAPTDNLLRSAVIALSSVSALIKLTPRRRALNDYAQIYAEQLGTAFDWDAKHREELLGAIRLFDERKYADAMQLLQPLKEAAAKRDDMHATALFIALCQTRLGLNDAAIATYEDAIRRGAASCRLYTNLGARYAAIGETNKAMDAYEEACAMDPEAALPWSNMANLLLAVGEYDMAERAAMMALELNPKQYESASVMAMLCAMQGRREEQEKYYRMAVQAGQDGKALTRAMEVYAARTQEKQA